MKVLPSARWRPNSEGLEHFWSGRWQKYGENHPTLNKKKDDAMTFPIRLLWINALLFILFGAGFIAAPNALSLFLTGAAPGTPSALTDMRATYGGMALGAGLLASLLVLSGIAGGRLVGILIDGSPNPFIIALFAAELLFAALFTITLKRVQNR